MPRTRRRVGDQFRERREAAQIDAGFDAIALTQAKHDFLQRRIAGALAEAVDRRIQMCRSGTRGRQCVGRCQTEVVVRVHFDVEIGRSPQSPDRFSNGKRIEHTQGIGEAEASRASGLRRLSQLHEKIRIGTRRILGANADFQPCIKGARDVLAKILQ